MAVNRIFRKRKWRDRTSLHLTDFVVLALVAVGAYYVRGAYPLIDWACHQAGETITDMGKLRGVCVNFDPDNVQNHYVGKAYFWGAFAFSALVSWTIFLKYSVTMIFAHLQVNWPKVGEMRKRLTVYCAVPLLLAGSLFVFYQFLFETDQFIFDFYYDSGIRQFPGSSFLAMNYSLMFLWAYLRRDHYMAHEETKVALAQLRGKDG